MGADGAVDNLTVLNGAQGVCELMNQMIAQAGPALSLARATLGAARDGDGDRDGARRNGRKEKAPGTT